MPTAQSQPAYQLSCLEVWGGNRNVSALVDLPGLRAWLDSHPFRSTGGGDLHYLSACNHGVVARIALADVSGHGEEVSGLAEKLRDLMRDYVNSWDQSDFMRELNNAFPKDRGGLKYASAAVLGFYSGSGEIVLTNAGHPPPLWYRAAARSWELMVDDSPNAKGAVEGLPLGLIIGTDYKQSAFQLGARDLVVIYTDGITESRDAKGRELGYRGLRELAQNIPTNSPSAAGQAMLAAVNEFRGHAAPADDETLVVLQRL
jgi:serine phosphatase RsbU (regulator of sigma subunit)